MPCYIVMGAQWGDEGKGKIVNLLADKVDLVVRFQGGANAGHTIVRNGEMIILHIIPSGILSEKCKNIVGNGCVVDPEQLIEEIEMLTSAGNIVSPENLVISRQAHIVTPVHKYMDKLLNKKIGTTGRGIGPCYVDKIQRTGIRLENIIDNSFKERYLEHANFYKDFVGKVYGEKFIDVNKSLEKLEKINAQLKPFIKDTVEIISDAVKKDDNILYEGAQGTFLDIDHGTYPYVTSSNTTIGGAYAGGGVFLDFKKIIGVVKAYTTRVGEGPFPTEQNNIIGDKLREKGQEFGATTGRPRRCGWLDLHLLKRSIIVNGFNYIALTKLDCFSEFKRIKVAVDYKSDNTPIFTEFEGWNESIIGITDYDKLSQNCKKYIEFIENFLKVPVGMISTGPDSKHIIFREVL